MDLMEGRWLRLKYAISGLEKTGLPLLGFDGTRYLPAEKGDDAGLYYFVPKLMSAFGFSVESAVRFFFVALIGLSFLSGLVGFFLLVKNWKARLLALPGYLLLLAVTVSSWDVYIALSAAVVAVVPLFLYLAGSRVRFSVFSGFMFLSGLWLSLCNSVRTHSGTAVLIFISAYFILDRKLDGRKRGLLFLVLLAGWSLPAIFLRSAIHSRNEFLQKNEPTFAVATGRHVLWHPIYIGLNFLSNEYGFPNSDQAVKTMVKGAAPEAAFASKDYDDLVKGVVLSAIKSHPYFFVRTLFAKAGVMFMYILVLGNVGMFFALRKTGHGVEKLSFAAGALFSSLLGFAVTPYHFYLLGLMAFATLMGMMGWSSDRSE